MANPDRGSDGAGGGATSSSWTRSRWLAEKIQSGELPAAADAMMEQCDACFVASQEIDGYVEVMAGILAGEHGGKQPHAERLARLRDYLDRLLSVREMWARERS